jgi:Na+-driven multidrug efflux pump
LFIYIYYIYSSPFSLVAQALLPRAIKLKNNKYIQKLLKLLFISSLSVATLCSLSNILIHTQFPNIFTSNLHIIKFIKLITNEIGFSQFLICLVTIFDGISIGFGKLNYYITSSILSTFMSVLFIFIANNSKFNDFGISIYWKSLNVFTIVRSIFYILFYKRILKL